MPFTVVPSDEMRKGTNYSLEKATSLLESAGIGQLRGRVFLCHSASIEDKRNAFQHLDCPIRTAFAGLESNQRRKHRLRTSIRGINDGVFAKPPPRSIHRLPMHCRFDGRRSAGNVWRSAEPGRGLWVVTSAIAGVWRKTASWDDLFIQAPSRRGSGTRAWRIEDGLC